MQTITITGASKGIGRATTEKFLEEGYQVIATSRDGTLPYTHERLQIIRLDYVKRETIHEAVEKIKNLNITIDILVNNAGIFLDHDDSSIDRETFQQTLDINLIGTIEFTEKLLPTINDDGHIMNISSMAGVLTEPVDEGWNFPMYKISKAALNMYTKTLAVRLKDRRILVSSVDPGWVRTDMGGSHAPRDPQEAAQDMFELAVRDDIETGMFWREGKIRSW